MATSRRPRVRVAVDVAKLSEELGTTVKEGKVTAERGKYFVSVGRLKREIVVGDSTPVAEVKALAGKAVGVVLSGRTIVAIGGLKRWIVCYIPAPILYRSIREELRGVLLNRYVEQKVIPARAAERLKTLGR